MIQAQKDKGNDSRANRKSYQVVSSAVAITKADDPYGATMTVVDASGTNFGDVPLHSEAPAVTVSGAAAMIKAVAPLLATPSSIRIIGSRRSNRKRSIYDDASNGCSRYRRSDFARRKLSTYMEDTLTSFDRNDDLPWSSLFKHCLRALHSLLGP